jgi:hypothetical protein
LSEVYVKEDGRQAETQIYQAMEFCDTEEGVTVKGVYHATARIVLGCRGLPGGRYTCDAEQSSSDADVLLRDGATELVRVTNCTARFNMGALTDGKSHGAVELADLLHRKCAVVSAPVYVGHLVVWAVLRVLVRVVLRFVAKRV